MTELMSRLVFEAGQGIYDVCRIHSRLPFWQDLGELGQAVNGVVRPVGAEREAGRLPKAENN